LIEADSSASADLESLTSKMYDETLDLGEPNHLFPSGENRMTLRRIHRCLISLMAFAA